MKNFAKIALSAALLIIVALSPLGIVALANDHDHYWDHNHGRGDYGRGDRDYGRGDMRGAPGPIAGAGLPILAVGYGVYWLIRRRQRQ
jgi:hypothetical protein